jgi:hypothetical protein
MLDAADLNAESWTVLAVLDDSTGVLDTEAHRARWADWLPWSNLLQFLGGPEERTVGVVAASSTADDLSWDDLWIRRRTKLGGAPAPAPAGSVVRELTQAEVDDLHLVVGDDVRDLVGGAVRAGAPMPLIGEEHDGVPIEASWPEPRVAVVAPGAPGPEGWDARPPEDWTIDALLVALEVDA